MWARIEGEMLCWFRPPAVADLGSRCRLSSMVTVGAGPVVDRHARWTRALPAAEQAASMGQRVSSSTVLNRMAVVPISASRPTGIVIVGWSFFSCAPVGAPRAPGSLEQRVTGP